MWLETILSCVYSIFIISIPLMWIGVLYFKIKCRKVTTCKKRKCLCWDMCTHNEEERKKRNLELRIYNAYLHRNLSGEDVDELLKKTGIEKDPGLW